MSTVNPLEALIGRASEHLRATENSGAERPAGGEYQAATVMLLAQIALEVQAIHRLLRAPGQQETTQ